MKKLTLTALALLVTLSVYAGSLERRETYDFNAATIERLQISHPVGSLEIQGYDGDEVRVELEVRCSAFRFRCSDRAEEIELDQRTTGDVMRLDVEGYPNNSGGLSVDLRIKVPRRLSVVLEKGVGDTTLRDIDGDLTVEAGVGDLDIYVPERGVRSLRAEAGVGGANLYVNGREAGHRDGFMFLGNEIEWSGEGSARLDVELGVGSLRIELE